MKFTTQAGDFYERVSIAAEVASRNEFALAAMTIEADASAQKVTLRCTDLDKSAAVECAAEVDKPGKLAVPARLLDRIAKAAKDAEKVTLALIKGRAKDSPGQCKVTDSDQGEWKVICIDPSTVVEINIEEDETAVAQLPHDLMRDLQQVVVPCAASDETRPLLCGIETVVREDETLCFTATDSYRLASLDTNPTSKAGAAARAVIPPGPFLSAAKHAPGPFRHRTGTVPELGCVALQDGQQIGSHARGEAVRRRLSGLGEAHQRQAPCCVAGEPGACDTRH